MSTAAWAFLVAFLINLALLVVAVAGNQSLAAENRRLRNKVRSLVPRDVYVEVGRERPIAALDYTIHRLRRGLDERTETWHG